MSTPFMQQCQTVSNLAEQLQKALDDLRPSVGDLPNASLIKIAHEVTRFQSVGSPPVPVEAANEEALQGGGDPVSVLPKPVRRVASVAREAFQGKEFAMADLGEQLKVGSRSLIPTFNSLERQGLFQRAGRGKRNNQEVNLYRLGKPLVVNPAS